MTKRKIIVGGKTRKGGRLKIKVESKMPKITPKKKTWKNKKSYKVPKGVKRRNLV